MWLYKLVFFVALVAMISNWPNPKTETKKVHYHQIELVEGELDDDEGDEEAAKTSAQIAYVKVKDHEAF